MTHDILNPRLGITVTALAAPLLVAIFFMQGRSPPPPRLPPVFEDHWPILKKADRMSVPVPVPVATPTPILVMQQEPEPELDQGQVIITKPELAPAVRHTARHYSDDSSICTRHHMHKVITHNGRSWRCRR